MRKWIVILALCAVACAKNEHQSLDTGYVPSGDAIGFTSQNVEDVATRGLVIENDFAQDDKIGLTAYFLDNGVWVDDKAPNFMYNQAVTLSGDVWSYSPVKYWPNDATDRLQFFGYYPHNDSGIVLSTNSTAGYPTIAFTPKTDVSQQVDFMTATTPPTAKTASVPLDFYHQLTQVKFSAKVDGENESVSNVQVTQIKHNGAKHGTGQYTSNGFEWGLTTSDSSQEYTISGEEQLEQNVALNTTTYTELVSKAGTMMLVPQTFDKDDVEITVNYNVTTTFSEVLYFEKAIKAPAHTFTKGKKTNYQFTIDLEDYYYIRLDTISNEKWNEKEVELELDDMFFNLTGNTRAYNWVDHTTDTERLTIGIEYETNLPTTAIKVEKVAATSDGELKLDTLKSTIFYTRDNIREILTDRLKVTLTFGSATRILYIDIEKKDMVIEFTVTVEPWDDEILDVEDLVIKFDVEVEEWENATGGNVSDGIIDVL